MGPMIGRANDGDTRRRQLMPFDYKGVDGTRFKVSWPRWVFTTVFGDDGHIMDLHNQDSIHNWKNSSIPWIFL